MRLPTFCRHFLSRVQVIIDIETTYKKVPNGLDPPEGREYIQKKYKKQYHINKNFCFAEYK